MNQIITYQSLDFYYAISELYSMQRINSVLVFISQDFVSKQLNSCEVVNKKRPEMNMENNLTQGVLI